MGVLLSLFTAVVVSHWIIKTILKSPYAGLLDPDSAPSQSA
jgi:preprotein translocase subunit SecD